MESRVGRARARVGGAFRRLVDALVDGAFGAVALCRRGSGRGALAPATDPLLLMPATSLAAKICSGEVSSESVVLAFTARIRLVAPVLQAVVDERFEAALDEARAVDRLVRATPPDERPALLARKPFLGVPITAKSPVGIQGLVFDAGLKCRRGVVAERDSDAVSAMREAGAVPLALTNVSELAMWWESFNKVHGRTNNPYDLRRIPGGSSGGEGSLLAAAGSVLGLGTDIGGSIRMPAFFNGVFGHKPSPGLVSNGGQFPHVQGHQVEFLGTGPLCRYAKDLVPALAVLAGPEHSRQVLRLHEPVDLKKVRVHVVAEAGQCFMISAVHPDVRKAVKDVATHLEQRAGLQVSAAKLPSLRYAFEMWTALMTSGDSPTFSDLLRDSGCPMSPGTELLRWMAGVSPHTFISISLVLLEKLGPAKDSVASRRLCAKADALQRDLETLLGEDGVLLLPTHPEPAPYHMVPTFRAFNFAYTGVFNVLRLPATACPVRLGEKSGLPVGVQIVAARNNDRLCLELAAEIERAFGGWRDPGLGDAAASGPSCGVDVLSH